MRRLERGWTTEELARQITSGGEIVDPSEIRWLEEGLIDRFQQAGIDWIAELLELPEDEVLRSGSWSGPACSGCGRSPPSVRTNRPDDRCGRCAYEDRLIQTAELESLWIDQMLRLRLRAESSW